jgi:hypothetical protein
LFLFFLLQLDHRNVFDYRKNEQRCIVFVRDEHAVDFNVFFYPFVIDVVCIVDKILVFILDDHPIHLIRFFDAVEMHEHRFFHFKQFFFRVTDDIAEEFIHGYVGAVQIARDYPYGCFFDQNIQNLFFIEQLLVQFIFFRDIPARVQELARVDIYFFYIDNENMLLLEFVGDNDLDILQFAFMIEISVRIDLFSEQSIYIAEFFNLYFGKSENDVRVGTDEGEFARFIRHENRIRYIIENYSMELVVIFSFQHWN